MIDADLAFWLIFGAFGAYTMILAFGVIGWLIVATLTARED